MVMVARSNSVDQDSWAQWYWSFRSWKLEAHRSLIKKLNMLVKKP